MLSISASVSASPSLMKPCRTSSRPTSPSPLTSSSAKTSAPSARPISFCTNRVARVETCSFVSSSCFVSSNLCVTISLACVVSAANVESRSSVSRVRAEMESRSSAEVSSILIDTVRIFSSTFASKARACVVTNSFCSSCACFRAARSSAVHVTTRAVVDEISSAT